MKYKIPFFIWVFVATFDFLFCLMILPNLMSDMMNNFYVGIRFFAGHVFMGCLTMYIAIKGDEKTIREENKTRESLGFDILKTFVLVTLYETDELLKAEDIRERLGLPKKYHTHKTNDLIFGVLYYFVDNGYVKRVNNEYVTFNTYYRWRITETGIEALKGMEG